MNQREKSLIKSERARRVAQAGSDRLAMMAGGYVAGRFMRNSKIQGYSLPLALGVVGLFGMRKAKSVGGQGARMGMASLIGMGAYGAGKLGEEQGVAAGNDGNLFSWSSEGGIVTD